MRPQRSYRDYLRDILQATEEALEFVQGMDHSNFSSDRKTNLAVVRSLEIIGEAARHVPLAVRRRHPLVPWQDMVGMRNKLIHQYYGVDSQVLWRTLQEDLPPLRDVIRGILGEMESEDQSS
ncbi:MAG: hypothetical protein BZY81_03825 [SAR202 cluster bacterium Io17-Chloro-G4]|nr:MAG: hypothetical protein BZY81_03825 [SAR202 cluster bacterium Io17-Chloro-G4]